MTADFDLGGMVRLRLQDARSRDLAAFRRQLDLAPQAVEGEADIVIRYVERLVPEGLCILGREVAGHTSEDFFLLGRGWRERGAVGLRLEKDGIELICQSGRGRIPLLVLLIHLAALQKGFLSLHAAVLVHRGRSLLVPGWAAGGKTETLLGFMDRGAQYVSDEWTLLDPGSRTLVGVPEPISLREWFLNDLPGYRERLALTVRGRLRGLAALQQAGDLLARTAGPDTPLGDLAGKLSSRIEDRRMVKLSPTRLFGPSACRDRAPLDVVVLSMTHDRPEVRLASLDSIELADRIHFLHRYERTPLLSTYHQLRFAFPDRVLPLIEELDRLESARLREVLKGTEAYIAYHPWPAPIPELVTALEPVLG